MAGFIQCRTCWRVTPLGICRYCLELRTERRRAALLNFALGSLAAAVAVAALRWFA